jgi:hypothetical protein
MEIFYKGSTVRVDVGLVKSFKVIINGRILSIEYWLDTMEYWVYDEKGELEEDEDIIFPAILALEDYMLHGIDLDN